MPKVTQEIIDLYDEYTHKPLPRRVFIERLSVMVGGTAAAYAMLPLLDNNYAVAAQIAENDPRITTERVTYKGAGNEMKAYVALPAGGAKAPAVVVIHENRGLNPHTEDVARRAAIGGFVAIAPDGLSPLGGTPPDPDKAREMIGQLNREQTIANMVATVAYAAKHARSTGKVGVVGFCWGGGMTGQMAVHANLAGIAAAAPFYGSQPAAEDVAKIKVPVQAHYAGIDERINAGIPAFEAALKANKVKHEIFIYEGAQHAFLNDTSTERYNEAAAKLAWQRTIDFFKKNLV